MSINYDKVSTYHQKIKYQIKNAASSIVVIFLSWISSIYICKHDFP